MASKCISVLGMCCRRTCTQITASRLFSVSVLRFTHKYPPGSAPPLKPSRYMAIYRDLHGAIEEPTAAKDFVYALDKKERDLLRTELENVEKLEQQTQEMTVKKPTAVQLKAVALHNTIPFIGFGFLDNLLMIVAGEYIELKFGAVLGISTMAETLSLCQTVWIQITGWVVTWFLFGYTVRKNVRLLFHNNVSSETAALGNWVSDLAGVQSVHYIEKLSSLYGVKAPALTPQQVDMSSTRWASNMGKAIGVSIGCVIGMFPLLFYRDPKEAKEEEEAPS